ncbi:MAG: tetratricopeptide repeat protein [Bacteroidales bacterium]|nr:tetratricopeptide repeat protein [Bacteroidales bacterium]
MKKIVFIILLTTLIPAAVIAQRSKEYYMTAAAMLNSGKTDSASLMLDAAIAREPDNFTFYLKKGEVEYLRGNITEALRNFEIVNSIKTGYADLWLAKSYAFADKDSMAIAYLKSHLQSDYRVREKIIKTDAAFNRLQLSEEWFRVWQENWYTEEDLLEEDINFMLKNDQYLDALALIDSKRPGSKNPGPLYRYKAQIAGDMGNYKAAAMDWTEFLNYNSDNPEALKERGNAYLNTGKFKESAEDFSRLLRIEPASFDVYILRAKAYQGQKNYNDAIKDLNLFLSYFPNDEAAIFFCGQLNYENGNYVEALRFFNRNLRIDNSKPDYFKARGKAYYQTKMYKYAIEDLSMSLDLNPNDGEVYYYKGFARYYSGDSTGACADWKIAARLGDKKAVEQIIKNCQ